MRFNQIGGTIVDDAYYRTHQDELDTSHLLTNTYLSN